MGDESTFAISDPFGGQKEFIYQKDEGQYFLRERPEEE
jgi:hypothetical protein